MEWNCKVLYVKFQLIINLILVDKFNTNDPFTLKLLDRISKINVEILVVFGNKFSIFFFFFFTKNWSSSSSLTFALSFIQNLIQFEKIF